MASLGAFDELKERVDAIVAERTRVVEALRMQGWFIPETQANFVVPPRRAQRGVHAGRPGGRADAAAVRQRRRAGHHQRDRGQRRADPRGREFLTAMTG